VARPYLVERDENFLNRVAVAPAACHNEVIHSSTVLTGQLHRASSSPVSRNVRAVRPVETARLTLTYPQAGDAEDLFVIASDPRVWGHLPSGRHTDIAQTHALISRWQESWEQTGLGGWVVRLRGSSRVIGYGGCTLTSGMVWNLGYRIAADEHGRGYATEVAFEAVQQATLVRPDLPVVAYLLEHNTASARVAVKLGFDLVHRGPDAGNPDQTAVRLVYASRQLTDAELRAILH
jgi:RimJ/RimL family protein N-acetyltransferase